MKDSMDYRVENRIESIIRYEYEDRIEERIEDVIL